MKKLLLLFIILSTFLFVSIGEVADIQFKVHVDVNINDESTKTVIKSHIGSKLRSLQDVVRVPWVEAEYFLKIAATDVIVDGEKTDSIVIAYCWYSRPSDTIHSPVIPIKGPYFTEPHLDVHGGPTEEWNNICGEIVAEFDQHLLETARRK